MIEGQKLLVGRVESGTIHEGDQVTIWPSRTKTEIKSIQFLWQERTRAEAGESIGLTLPDAVSVKRGDIISNQGHNPSVTDTIEPYVFWMDPKSLENHEKMVLRCAAQEVPVRIEQISERINSSTLETIEESTEKLENSEVGRLVVKTELPIVIKNFNDLPELGRFVLERDLGVCGGGIIV